MTYPPEKPQPDMAQFGHEDQEVARDEPPMPMRGVLVALVLSVPIWALILWVVW